MTTETPTTDALNWWGPLDGMIKSKLSWEYFHHSKYWTLSVIQIILIHEKETQND